MTLPYTTRELSHRRSDSDIALAESVTPHNYHPLPVVLSAAEGAWVTDVEGRPSLASLPASSPLTSAHGPPAILAAARQQLDRLTLTSRAFHNDRLGPFC